MMAMMPMDMMRQAGNNCAPTKGCDMPMMQGYNIPCNMGKVACHEGGLKPGASSVPTVKKSK